MARCSPLVGIDSPNHRLVRWDIKLAMSFCNSLLQFIFGGSIDSQAFLVTQASTVRFVSPCANQPGDRHGAAIDL